MLQEADLGLTTNAFSNQSGNARFAGDETLLVRFFTNPKINQTKTAEEGRPIFEEVAYIQIMQPGNKDSIIMRPATTMDKQRFPDHFRKFEAREDQNTLEGTPLAEWPGVTRSQCEELKYFNVRTVEQLVGMSDSNSQGMMGINVLRQKAAQYLEVSKDNAGAEALKAAHDHIEQLTIRLDAMEAAQEATED